MSNPVIQKAQANPTKIFDNPADVLRASISAEWKLKVLRSWEDEAHQLQAAADESMTGGEPSRLDEVRNAIDQIETEKTAPVRHPSGANRQQEKQ